MGFGSSALRHAMRSINPSLLFLFGRMTYGGLCEWAIIGASIAFSYIIQHATNKVVQSSIERFDKLNRLIYKNVLIGHMNHCRGRKLYGEMQVAGELLPSIQVVSASLCTDS